MATPPTRRLTDMDITPAVTTDGTDILRNMGRANATLLNNSDKQAVAQKLRDKGWSYRRISETLGVQYILVSRWLNGDMNQQDTPTRGAEYYNDDPELKDAKPPPKAKRKTVNNNESRLETLDDALDMVETLRLQMNAMDKYVRDALKQIEVTTRQWQEREAAVQLELEQFCKTADERETHLRTELAKLRDDIGRGGGSTSRRQDVEEDKSTDEDDPFADSSSDDDADPFADLNSDDDPFADLDDKPKTETKAEDDPFADLNSDDDPFADLDDKPKTETKAEDDPFADLNSESDPFADLDDTPKTETKAEDDPFADLDDTPKTETKAEDDPFADLNSPSEEKAPEPEPEKPKGLARLKFWGRKK